MTRKKLSQNEDEFIKGAVQPASQPAAKATPKTQSKDEILNQILQPAPPAPKEPQIRFTVDMSLQLHRRLSVAAAKAGKSKADIVREVLNTVLPSEQ